MKLSFRSLIAFSAFAACTSAQALDLQGHRGARGLAPENTLPAFAVALTLGVDTLELDTGVTKDGVVVISHERRLHPDTTRGPDGQWLPAPGPALVELTYAELQRYDVGRLNPATNYGKPFPAQKPVDGARIPRLADLFALVRKSGNTTVRFNIETKLDPGKPAETLPPEAFARAVIREVRAAGMASRTTIQSFDWRTLKVVQAEAPEIATVYLSTERGWLKSATADNAWTAGLRLADYGSIAKMVHAAGGRNWSPFHADMDAARLTEARALGLKVVVWTVNDPKDISAMLDLQVDGIISDRPDLVREEMKKRGMALPAGTPVAP
jgi:glycerophosphoryl diester phosphodiesterase